MGPGVRLTDITPPRNGRFVTRDEFLDRAFAELSQQAPVDTAAITGYRGAPFGTNVEEYRRMLDANRADVNNRLSSLWIAAANQNDIRAFEIALDAQRNAALNWETVAAAKTKMREAVWAETANLPVGPAGDARWQQYFDDVNALVQNEGWANEKRYYDEALARIKGMGGEAPLGAIGEPRAPTPTQPTPARMPVERLPETNIPEQVPP